MTPFMIKVAEAVQLGSPAEKPVTRPSRPKPIGVAADEQVAIRSLAEQLVSEANAVLESIGEEITLVDDVGEGHLAFTLGYQGRRSHVATGFTGRTAVARLHGIGSPCHSAVELDGAEAVEGLLLLLLAKAAPQAKLAHSGCS